MAPGIVCLAATPGKGRDPVTLRILFVEKDLTTADLLVPSLERKGYEVMLVSSQRQATLRIHSFSPDLLVVDMHSFGGKGFAVCDALRTRLEGVPTILLVGDRRALAADSVDSYMTLPFTSRKLLYRIRKVAEHLGPRHLRAGPLTLDPDIRILYKGDDELYLRPKEAALLALFMANPGRVLTRPEIMQQVWNTDFTDDTRMLNVHIRWLRLKIEDNPSAPRYLRTVRGVGYRFEV
jgi:DNA-binding response OmpR family regulator